MNIEKLIQIKDSYIKYEITENKKYKDEIMLLFLEDEFSIELMESINKNLLDNSFDETIQFLFFMYGFNYHTEELITRLEKISINIVLIEYDEYDEVINKEYSMVEKFRVYKNKFL